MHLSREISFSRMGPPLAYQSQDSRPRDSGLRTSPGSGPLYPHWGIKVLGQKNHRPTRLIQHTHPRSGGTCSGTSFRGLFSDEWDILIEQASHPYLDSHSRWHGASRGFTVAIRSKAAAGCPDQCLKERLIISPKLTTSWVKSRKTRPRFNLGTQW